MKTNRALIGYTGFVGSNLLNKQNYDLVYNSKNIDDINGREFERVVCAGVSAKKWMANQEPANDRRMIGELIDNLKTLRTDCFVLISTIDVYMASNQATEDVLPVREGLHPYGLNRLELEDFVREYFPTSVVIRLPALFGPGLRKNALYDLLHNNMLEMLNPSAIFQWYPVERLAKDIETAVTNQINLVHMATEPVMLGDIISQFFPEAEVGEERDVPAYDFRTVHASAFGGNNEYILDRQKVFEGLSEFITRERGK